MNDNFITELFNRVYIEDLEDWLEYERVRWHPDSRLLTEEENQIIGRHISEDILQTVRVVVLPNLKQVTRPNFYKEVSQSLEELPIDLEKIAGLTLIDMILISEDKLNTARPLISVLFQECVHVCQFKLYGTQGFLTHYIEGWIKSQERTHQAIPLERVASLLRESFEQDPVAPLRVEQQIIAMQH